MTDKSRISNRLNMALGLFVSVPMFAMPVAAQTKPTLSLRERLGVRAGARLSVEGDTKVISGIRTSILTDARTGIEADIVVPSGHRGLVKSPDVDK